LHFSRREEIEPLFRSRRKPNQTDVEMAPASDHLHMRGIKGIDFGLGVMLEA